mgnify:CR=1 FL=1
MVYNLFMKILILLGVAISVALGRPSSDHYDGKTFRHPWGANDAKGFLTVLRWKLTGSPERWPQSVPYAARDLSPPPAKGADVTWVNHSTFLIRFPGLTVLTDPIWSERASPFSFLGPRRVHPPGIAFEQLPRIDVVVISHNEGRDRPLFLVPLGDKEWLLGKGLTRVVEKDWWEEEKIGDVDVTFTPAQHWSARTLWDRNESLWGGWWIRQGETSLYHAGDTGLGPHFKMVRDRLGSPDVALLPIGAYEPRWFMEANHMNPAEAVKAALQLGASTNVAMHFGTFPLADEGHPRPPEDLNRALLSHPELDFRVPQIGEGLAFE